MAFDCSLLFGLCAAIPLSESFINHSRSFSLSGNAPAPLHIIHFRLSARPYTNVILILPEYVLDLQQDASTTPLYVASQTTY